MHYSDNYSKILFTKEGKPVFQEQTAASVCYPLFQQDEAASLVLCYQGNGVLECFCQKVVFSLWKTFALLENLKQCTENRVKYSLDMCLCEWGQWLPLLQHRSQRTVRIYRLFCFWKLHGGKKIVSPQWLWQHQFYFSGQIY